jgi:hypothetical protein
VARPLWDAGVEKQPLHPLAKAALVFILGAGISVAGWKLLGFIPAQLSRLVNPGNCSGLSVGTPEMYLCSAKVGLLTLTGPLLLIAVMFIFRKALSRLVKQILPSIPDGARFLAAPIVATLLFAMVWAGIHFQTGQRVGILPQKTFPALIGLFSFLTSHFLPQLQQKLKGLLDFRDKFPKWLRIVGVVLIPMLISLIITKQARVTQVAFKEQLVVLISLTLGFLALMPRTGSLAAGLRQFTGQNPDKPQSQKK